MKLFGDIINGQKMICLYYHRLVVVVVIMTYQYSTKHFNKSSSFFRLSSTLTPTLNLSHFKKYSELNKCQRLQ